MKDAKNDCQDATLYPQPQLSIRQTSGSFLGYGSKFETKVQVWCVNQGRMFFKNSCFVKKISLDISFWAKIAVTNMTMRILYILTTKN